MGGWGKSSGKREIESYDFKMIGTIKEYNGPGKVKILLQQSGNANKTPVYAYKENTIYLTLDIITGKLDHIYYYEGHYLKKSIDLLEKCGPHFHYWKHTNDSVERVSHNKKNIFTDFTQEDLYYINEGNNFVNINNK